MCAGIHSHSTLSQIASASREDGPSPSHTDTAHSTTTQDSSSTTEHQHKPTDNSLLPQQQSLGKPLSDISSRSPAEHSKHRVDNNESSPRSDQPQAQAQGGKGDPSALSITMLSSDYASFQRTASASTLQLEPGSQPKSFPPKAPFSSAVRVPSGEMDPPSEQSFESTATTTSSEEGLTRAATKSPPLFHRVAALDGEASTGSTAPASCKPSKTNDMSVSDLTESDVLATSTTSYSKSTNSPRNESSSNSGDGSGGTGGGGVLEAMQAPIKGILKHPTEKKTHPVAQSLPNRRGKDKGLVFGVKIMVLKYAKSAQKN